MNQYLRLSLVVAVLTFFYVLYGDAQTVNETDVVRFVDMDAGMSVKDGVIFFQYDKRNDTEAGAAYARKNFWKKNADGLYEVIYDTTDIRNTGGMALLLYAQDYIMRGSNIIFRERRSDDEVYVVVRITGNICHIRLSLDRVQSIEMYVPQVCWTNALMLHETLHTLGFIHEHSRPDRDMFLDVERLTSYPDNNIDIIEEPLITSPYDVYSIMHYPDIIGPVYRFKPRDPNLGRHSTYQRAFMSSCDWYVLNEKYPGKKRLTGCRPNSFPKLLVPSASFASTTGSEESCQYRSSPLFEKGQCILPGHQRFPRLEDEIGEFLVIDGNHALGTTEATSYFRRQMHNRRNSRPPISDSRTTPFPLRKIPETPDNETVAPDQRSSVSRTYETSTTYPLDRHENIDKWRTIIPRQSLDKQNNQNDVIEKKKVKERGEALPESNKKMQPHSNTFTVSEYYDAVLKLRTSVINSVRLWEQEALHNITDRQRYRSRSDSAVGKKVPSEEHETRAMSEESTVRSRDNKNCNCSCDDPKSNQTTRSHSDAGDNLTDQEKDYLSRLRKVLNSYGLSHGVLLDLSNITFISKKRNLLEVAQNNFDSERNSVTGRGIFIPTKSMNFTTNVEQKNEVSFKDNCDECNHTHQAIREISNTTRKVLSASFYSRTASFLANLYRRSKNLPDNICALSNRMKSRFMQRNQFESNDSGSKDDNQGGGQKTRRILEEVIGVKDSHYTLFRNSSSGRYIKKYSSFHAKEQQQDLNPLLNGVGSTTDNLSSMLPEAKGNQGVASLHIVEVSSNTYLSRCSAVGRQLLLFLSPKSMSVRLHEMFPNFFARVPNLTHFPRYIRSDGRDTKLPQVKDIAQEGVAPSVQTAHERNYTYKLDEGRAMVKQKQIRCTAAETATDSAATNNAGRRNASCTSQIIEALH